MATPYDYSAGGLPLSLLPPQFTQIVMKGPFEHLPEVQTAVFHVSLNLPWNRQVHNICPWQTVQMATTHLKREGPLTVLSRS